MFSTAIAAAVSALISAAAGTAVGIMVSGSRFRVYRGRVEQIEQVLPMLVGRQEVGAMFSELAMIEEQRHQQAQARRQLVAPFPTQAPAPVPSQGAQDVNELLIQQLAGLNARLQQVNSMRGPNPSAGYSQQSAG
jgi:hypothetical protein